MEKQNIDAKANSSINQIQDARVGRRLGEGLQEFAAEVVFKGRAWFGKAIICLERVATGGLLFWKPVLHVKSVGVLFGCK